MYMYTKPSTQFDVNWFHTLLWTNAYEFQLCSHNDVEHTCTKTRQVIGASVCPLTPIKSDHSWGSKSRSFTWGGGVRKKTSTFDKIYEVLKTKTFVVGVLAVFCKILFNVSLTSTLSCKRASPNEYELRRAFT